MTRPPPNKPLIAIIGATGTGKSQLAVELARRHNGEIINGDAMQLYAGLPIITNKITAEEQQGVPHHLLGCIDLRQQTWVVGTFVKTALKVIEEIRARGRLPILVGGTHYYTQSLLFHDRLAGRDGDVGDGGREEEVVSSDDRQQWPILEQPTEVLLEELQRVDPAMAERWHPKDRRKIQRSLEIFLKTGEKASDVYARQRSRQTATANDGASLGAQDGTPDGLTMRFPTLVLWVHAETNTLRERLDQRVDKMLQTGLLDEVHTLNADASASASAGRAVDETRGIWVSIGYKEFKAFARALEKPDGLSEAELGKIGAQARERTQIATRQYAKRQVRWIRIKLLDALREARAEDRIFLLDGSDVSQFDTAVVRPAEELTRDFLQGAPLPSASSLSELAAEFLQSGGDFDAVKSEGWTKQYCEVCDVTCVIAQQWRQHTGSKAHKKLVSKRKKLVDSQNVVEEPQPP